MSGTIPCNRERLKTEARASLIFSLASFMHFTGIPRVALLSYFKYIYQVMNLLRTNASKHEAVRKGTFDEFSWVCENRW